jgi:DNA-binding HxlR family transcriptional regulator
VLGRTYNDENCSAARALEVAGERWSLLILRDSIFRGLTRFSEFERSLGLATNVLASRLDRFVAEGLMELVPTSDQSDQLEYRITQKGLDFEKVLVALTAWGDKWSAPDGPPIQYHHADCGGPINIELRCSDCSKVVLAGDVLANTGPPGHSNS